MSHKYSGQPYESVFEGKHIPDEKAEEASFVLQDADVLIILIGDEINSFTHMRWLDYGPIHFWRDYPEFKQDLKVPQEMFNEKFLEENPETFWGLSSML